MSCVHTGAFGASIGCSECNKDLEALIDSPVRFRGIDLGREEFIQAIQWAGNLSCSAPPRSELKKLIDRCFRWIDHVRNKKEELT
jgi:hypothetical protein